MCVCVYVCVHVCMCVCVCVSYGSLCSVALAFSLASAPAAQSGGRQNSTDVFPLLFAGPQSFTHVRCAHLIRQSIRHLSYTAVFALCCFALRPRAVTPQTAS